MVLFISYILHQEKFCFLLFSFLNLWLLQYVFSLLTFLILMDFLNFVLLLAFVQIVFN